MEKLERVLGGLFGLAIGDALGVPVEFRPREELKRNPVRDMIGYGTHNQPPGTWSDDSSLAFCLAESLCRGFNINDIARRFIRWFDEGYWTPYGMVFDVGNTTYRAITRLKRGIDPLKAGPDDELSNGNGSLMRILPLAFYVEESDASEQFEMAHMVSRITHGHLRSQMACGIYIQLAVNLLKGFSRREAYERTKKIAIEYYSNEPYYGEMKHFKRILQHDISKFPEEEIDSSGYVVDTLEASIWSFLNSDSYEEAVLTAVNLGGDTDTVGAVTGGLAGIYYGYGGIPEKWIERVARREDIMDLGLRLYESIYVKFPQRAGRDSNPSKRDLQSRA